MSLFSLFFEQFEGNMYGSSGIRDAYTHTHGNL